MSQTGMERKVGIFVFIGLVLIGALLLSFSKGTSLLTPSYEVIVKTRNVGGIRTKSAVFLSGVQVGNVSVVELADGGKAVHIRLKILKRFPIYSDASFFIEQIGVLGDQFVAIRPGENKAPLLKDGDEVEGIEAFNLQEVARSANGLIQRFDQLASAILDAVNRVNKQVLDARTLSNFSGAIGNFGKVSERALDVVDTVALLVETNAVPFGQSMSNLVRFSADLEKLAMDLDHTFATNREDLTLAVKNFQTTSLALRNLTADLEKGKGPVGSLLRDEALQLQLAQTMANLNVVSSNMARFGIFYKPKQPRPKTVYPGKPSF